jgi:glycolate oxidase iron-sulfur subunit
VVKLNEEKTKALERCNKCGFCLAHCPIYKVTGVEWTGARGRISLIRSALLEGKLDIKELNEPVFNCLTCNACVDDCPAGVQTADIIFSTREEIYKAGMLNRWLFRNILTNPSRLHNAVDMLKFVDVMGLRSAARKTGLINLIGDAGKAESIVPTVPRYAGLKNIIKMIPEIEHPKYKAAYFVGCFAANLAPGEAAATIRILQKHQVEVTIPEFACCGIPAPAYGEMESARIMARKNIEIAAKLNVDAIVTPCASCSSFLKEYGKLLADEPQWAEKARTFSSKVKDLSEFLVNIGLVTEMSSIKNKVTYHDPCHLVRYQKIKIPQRTILKSIPGVEFVELKEADMCCGAAGTYGFKNYDLSMKVLARKMDNVQNTGAGILVSSCPACIMQLTHGVKSRKMSIRTVSVVELLDEAYSLFPAQRLDRSE